MTETTNLGLPIYSDSDVPDWMNTNDGFEALDSLVNSCADVQLDFAHPLHKFTTGNLTYTTTKECYLYGSINASQNTYTTLTIDGNVFASVTGSQSNYYEQGFEIGPIRLRSGTVVTLSSQGWNPNLYILDGTLISGNTYVFNEAQVTLDYANPLFTFGSNNLSYTATKKCYLAGVIPAKYDGNITLSIDGTVVYQATYSNNTGQGKPIPILTIEAGSTVTLNTWAGSVSCLHVFDGTVTGTVGALNSNVPDYSNLITSLAYNVETYTATQECIVEMQAIAKSGGPICIISVNGNVIGYALNDAGGYIPFVKTIHLQKGDILTWNNSHTSAQLFVCNVFGIL